MRLPVIIFCSLFFLAHASNVLAAQGVSDVAARTKKLNALIDEQWQYSMRESPEAATSIGDYRYNDRWSDLSLKHVEEVRKATKNFLARFRAIDTQGLPDQDQLNHRLMVQSLADDLESMELKLYEMPVDQFAGLQIGLPGLVPSMPFDSVKHYQDYLKRLKALPMVFLQAQDLMRQGRRDGMMPPRFILEKVVEQCRSVSAPAGLQSPFGQPLQSFPEGMSASQRARLTKQIVHAIDHDVRPAYARFINYLQKDYVPFGRTEPGLWALPNGDAIYRYQVRHMTTTKMSPQAIHDLGLTEVTRIENEMTTIAKALGFSDLSALRSAVATDPKLMAKSPEAILEAYRNYIAAMNPKLPELFGLLPTIGVEVRAVQAYREKDAAGAEYSPGTPDGSRAGIVFVNTGDFAQRETVTIESTAYHEGVPGHHMQIAIAQKLQGLPLFRQNAGYTAYQEGWALYAERLGKDIGFYQDPYSDYGRLVSELLRADRLVLDTGVHYKHWTREQMVSFFREHAAGDEPTIQAETDRYISIPGQALAYKIGQLRFLELRDRAKRTLGERFDIRAFHDQMLVGGALPLDILESRYTDWLNGQLH